MPEPAEYLLAALHSCEEFWDIFRTRVHALVLAVMSGVKTYLPIDINIRITASFAPPWSGPLYTMNLVGTAQNIGSVLTTTMHTLLQLHYTGPGGTIRFEGQWYWKRSSRDQHGG